MQTQNFSKKSLIGMNVYKILLICIESQRSKLKKTIQTINELKGDIKKRFQYTKFTNAEKLKVQKFEKDFNNKIQVYTQLLKKFEELNQLRQSYSIRRSTIINSNHSNSTYNPNTRKKQQEQSEYDEESEQGVKIELQEVNQETLFQEHMLQLKQKQILQVKKKMDDALNAQKQVATLVNAQGQQINQIQQNVDSARSNVQEAGQLLQEGVQHHMSAKQKKCCIFAVVFVCLIIIVVPIMVKFL